MRNGTLPQLSTMDVAAAATMRKHAANKGLPFVAATSTVNNPAKANAFVSKPAEPSDVTTPILYFSSPIVSRYTGAM